MENKEIKTYRLIIKGKVQNVGFRHWFSDLARSEERRVGKECER